MCVVCVRVFEVVIGMATFEAGVGRCRRSKGVGRTGWIVLCRRALCCVRST